MNSNEVFLSFDIETNGSAPYLHSMLSLACVAFIETFENGEYGYREIGSWYEKFKTLPNAVEDPGTMEWWKRFPEAYKEATTNPKDPKENMISLVNWACSLGKSLVFVCDPSAWDGMFLSWYLIRFGYHFETLPWKHRVMDIRTYMSCITDSPFHGAHRKTTLRKLGIKLDLPEHDHVPLNDAREQGITFMEVRRWRHQREFSMKSP